MEQVLYLKAAKKIQTNYNFDPCNHILKSNLSFAFKSQVLKQKTPRPVGQWVFAALKAHLCGPSPNFQKVLFAFWSWLWRRTIIKADGTPYSSVFSRFEVQVSCLPYPRFLWKLHASIWTIPQLYHPHRASTEQVWCYIPLWTVFQN